MMQTFDFSHANALLKSFCKLRILSNTSSKWYFSTFVDLFNETFTEDIHSGGRTNTAVGDCEYFTLAKKI